MTRPYCPHCKRPFKLYLKTYSSGDGSLNLIWQYNDPASKTASKKVTKKDAQKYLQKEGKHLENWVPVLINNRWILVKIVHRTGKNRVRVDGQTYYYEWDKTIHGDAYDGNVKITFKSTFRIYLKIKVNLLKLWKKIDESLDF